MHARLATARLPARCSACDADGAFTMRPVLSRRLARQWRLDPIDRATINVQQGHMCAACGNNVRSRALADALRRELGTEPTLAQAIAARGDLALLEINPAGNLTSFLAGARRHVRTSYPEVDMQALPFETGAFDVAVHSDVLEHVDDPVAGLRECMRVVGDGQVIFTTPWLLDRLTLQRADRRPSYHGGDSGRSLVKWEFGSDLVEMILSAGATSVTIHSVYAPYAHALSCRRE